MARARGLARSDRDGHHVAAAADEDIGGWGYEEMGLVTALLVERHERSQFLKSAHAAPEAPLGVHVKAESVTLYRLEKP